jgi:uncharacterized protein (DUF1778 family)
MLSTQRDDEECIKMPVAQRAENPVQRAPKRSKAGSVVTQKKPRASSSKAKTYNLRVDDVTDRLIDDALAVLGQSRTEFVLTSAKLRAQEVLLSRVHLTLSSKAWEALEADLAAPAFPNAELVALMSRTPLWER